MAIFIAPGLRPQHLSGAPPFNHSRWAFSSVTNKEGKTENEVTGPRQQSWLGEMPTPTPKATHGTQLGSFQKHCSLFHLKRFIGPQVSLCVAKLEAVRVQAWAACHTGVACVLGWGVSELPRWQRVGSTTTALPECLCA